jgi:hypothetical protein
VSENRLFSAGDWAQPDIAGSYVSENSDGDAQAKVVLSPRADGLFDSLSTKLDDEGEVEKSVVGFVAVEGGSGSYFLMVDRTSEKDEGEIYLFGHLEENGRLEAFFPQCAGTPDGPGMTREVEQLIKEEICSFSTKAGLMRAALAAEQYLSSPHMFEPKLLGRLVPDDSAGEEESWDVPADEMEEYDEYGVYEDTAEGDYDSASEAAADAMEEAATEAIEEAAAD